MNAPGTGGHPDVETLADLDAGTLDAPASADLRAHLAACADCAQVEEQLAGLHVRLAGLPPVPMPSDVAARIDAALSEAARGPAVTGGTVVPLTGRQRSTRRWALPAGAVAAGVAVLFAGAVGFGALRAAGPSHDSSAIGGRKAASPAPFASTPEIVSGQNYSAPTLAAGVRALVTTGKGPGTPDRPAAGANTSPHSLTSLAVDAALVRLSQPAALQECITELAGQPGVAPLAVDFARFQGSPVAVVVLPDKDSTRVQAWVVGPNCAAGRADLRRYEVVRLGG